MLTWTLHDISAQDIMLLESTACERNLQILVNERHLWVRGQMS